MCNLLQELISERLYFIIVVFSLCIRLLVMLEIASCALDFCKKTVLTLFHVNTGKITFSDVQ